MSQIDTNINFSRAFVDENRSTNIVVACILCLSAAYIAVILRFCSRRINRAPLGIDDGTIVLSLVKGKNF